MAGKKTIGAIEFGVLSPEMIRKMSTVEVTIPETYDADGFPIEGGLMDPRMGVVDPGLRCKTCGQKMNRCPGHFGRIELVRPVIHTEYVKYVEGFLHATCPKCGRIVFPDETIEKVKRKFKPKTRFKHFAKKGSEVRKCPHCGFERPKIKFEKPANFFEVTEDGEKRIWPTEIRERLERIPDKDVEALGFDPTRFRPEWLILTVLPVPPVTIRPSIILETGERAEDDLTHKLADIVTINLRLRENIDAGAPQLIIEDLWDLLQYHVTTFFNNEAPGVPPARHRSGRPLKTLVQRLKGKEGRFRYNLSGKRVNFAGRSVITPDIRISVGEVGVPRQMAEEVTVPVHVTEWNIEEVKKLIMRDEYPRALYIVRPNGSRKRITPDNREDILEELAPGYIVERQVMDGDIALFNRQPSLHRISLMAHRVRVLPGKTLRINPLANKPYNADFDGDEMNIHFVQTKDAQTEAREIIAVKYNMLSPRHGRVLVTADEDAVTGMFVLTWKDTKFTREQAARLLYSVGITDIPEPDEDGMVSGKKVFSKLLPKGVNLEFPAKLCKIVKEVGYCKGDCKKCEYDAYVVIRDGELVSGVIDEAAVGAGGKLVDYIYRVYGPDVAQDFVDKMGIISTLVFDILGFTISYEELKISEETRKKIEKILEEGEKKANEYIKLYEEGKLEPIPGFSERESLEIYIIQSLEEARKEVTRLVQKEKFEEFLRNPKAAQGFIMIISGARGRISNIINMSAMQGQAYVRERRPHRGFMDRVTAHFKPGDISPRARGFVKRSLKDGLGMLDLFFWGMGGRIGEVDKGVSTQISGYYYRRLSNALMDVVVFPDGTLREVTNDYIVSFKFGDDGLFPMYALDGRLPLDTLLGMIRGGKK